MRRRYIIATGKRQPMEDIDKNDVSNEGISDDEDLIRSQAEMFKSL